MSCIRGIWNRGIELNAFGPALQAIAGKPAPTRAGATITASAVPVGAGLPAGSEESEDELYSGDLEPRH